MSSSGAGTAGGCYALCPFSPSPRLEEQYIFLRPSRDDLLSSEEEVSRDWRPQHGDRDSLPEVLPCDRESSVTTYRPPAQESVFRDEALPSLQRYAAKGILLQLHHYATWCASVQWPRRKIATRRCLGQVCQEVPCVTHGECWEGWHTLLLQRRGLPRRHSAVGDIHVSDIATNPPVQTIILQSTLLFWCYGSGGLATATVLVDLLLLGHRQTDLSDRFPNSELSVERLGEIAESQSRCD